MGQTDKRITEAEVAEATKTIQKYFADDSAVSPAAVKKALAVITKFTRQNEADVKAEGKRLGIDPRKAMDDILKRAREKG